MQNYIECFWKMLYSKWEYAFLLITCVRHYFKYMVIENVPRFSGIISHSA
jgi:hypothetical protein